MRLTKSVLIDLIMVGDDICPYKNKKDREWYKKQLYSMMTIEELIKYYKEKKSIKVDKTKAIWFEKGQKSVLRKNKSGCACIIDDLNDNIIEVCGAHQNWLDKRCSILLWYKN